MEPPRDQNVVLSTENKNKTVSNIKPRGDILCALKKVKNCVLRLVSKVIGQIWIVSSSVHKHANLTRTLPESPTASPSLIRSGRVPSQVV